MNEFESDWISLSQSQSRGRVFFRVNLRKENKVSEFHYSEAESKMAEFKMATIIKLSQNELVWVRVRVEGECFWVNLREDNKVSEFHNAEAESKMAEFKMAKIKMASIIKFSLNEWVMFFVPIVGREMWVKFYFVQMVGTNLGKYEWVWEEKLRWMNTRWPNSRWLTSSSWVRMNEFESDWISLSQIELVWVRVRVEGGCFWMNLREENKVSEFHNAEAESKMAEFKMAEIKMATIIKLNLNEWVKFFCANGGGKCEWRYFCANGGNQSWQVWVSLRWKTKMAESKMAEFKMADIIKLSENEWVLVRLN